MPLRRRRWNLLFAVPLALATLLGSLDGSAAPVPIAPEKGVIIVNQDEREPLWKQNWDEARAFVQQGRHEDAIARYLGVLAEKPLIEEATWELVKALMVVTDYQQAAFHLERLLELDPDRRDYLLCAGTIALAQGNHESAIGYFGHVLQQDPQAVEADEALTGMIAALTAQGKTQLALPLMEQLYQRSGSDRELLLALARGNRDVGLSAKAAHFFDELLKRFDVSDTIEMEAASLFEQTGQADLAAPLWQRFLEDHPEDLEVRQKLADYHRARNEAVQALPHLIVLAENGINRQEHLLQIAKIYLLESGRADRALAYLDQYRQEFPDGEDVSSEIADIQLILANDLLTIVENDGASMLWRDLAEVTPDRLGIYRAMAGLLEELQRTKELIDVLQIVVKHDQNDLHSLEKLATHYRADGQFKQCLSTLRQAEKRTGTLPAPLYLLRGQCEQQLGQDEQRLESLRAYLALRPADREILLQAIELAGACGRMDLVVELRQNSPVDLQRDDRLLLAYIDAHLANQLYGTAVVLIDRLADTRGRREASYSALQLRKAEALHLRGDGFRAEQVLRQVLVAQPESADALLLLADHALRRRDFVAAGIWLSAVERIEKSGVGDVLDTAQKPLYFSCKIRYQWFTENRQDALARALDYFSMLEPSKALDDTDLHTFVFVLDRIAREQRLSPAVEQLAEAIPDTTGSANARIIAALLAVSFPDRGAGSPAEAPVASTTAPLSLAEQFALCSLLLEMGNLEEADRRLQAIERRVPQSMRLLTLQARLHQERRDYEQARDIYEGLSTTVDEPFYREQLGRFDYLLGRSLERIDRATIQHAGLAGGASAAQGVAMAVSDAPQATLNDARALWAANRWEESLQRYNRLYRDLDERVRTALQSIVESSVLPRYFPQLESKSAFLSVNEEALLDEIMDSVFFLRHRTEEISRRSVSFYEEYRWWKLVKKEREAKRALNAREFYQAERKYQELYDLDKSAAEDSYQDMATIYSRLGKRQKESQLYEKLKDTKREIPELQAALAKNVRQQQPHVSLDASYREEKGRDGAIDIRQGYGGVNVQFTPTLFHDAGFWFGRSEYGDSEIATFAKSVFLNGRYALQFNDKLEGMASLGLEEFDSVGDSFILYDVTLKSRLEEKVNVFLSLNQSPVSDTATSIAEGIYRKQFQAGVSLEYLPRIFLGFDFSLHDYNDRNDGKTFNLYASYRYFQEVSSLDFTYRYRKMENSIASDDFTSDPDADAYVPPYWSPGKYWRHLVSAEYRHELWPTGRLQGGTSYISGIYGVGVEKGDTIVQQTALAILLELSPVFLVKGSISSDWSSDFDRHDLSASLVYRW